MTITVAATLTLKSIPHPKLTWAGQDYKTLFEATPSSVSQIIAVVGPRGDSGATVVQNEGVLLTNNAQFLNIKGKNIEALANGAGVDITGLGEVLPTGITVGQGLQWNGTAWALVPSTVVSIRDEGSLITAGPEFINFVGSTVSATQNGSGVNVTVSAAAAVGTAGAIQQSDGLGNLTSSSSLFWKAQNNQLIIGTEHSPIYPLTTSQALVVSDNRGLSLGQFAPGSIPFVFDSAGLVLRIYRADSPTNGLSMFPGGGGVTVFQNISGGTLQMASPSGEVQLLPSSGGGVGRMRVGVRSDNAVTTGINSIFGTASGQTQPAITIRSPGNGLSSSLSIVSGVDLGGFTAAGLVFTGQSTPPANTTTVAGWVSIQIVGGAFDGQIVKLPFYV